MESCSGTARVPGFGFSSIGVVRRVMIGATSDESRAVREARFSIEAIPEGTETRPVSETCHGSRGIFVVVKKHQLSFSHSSRGCVEERLLLEMRIGALFSNAL
jgi:hypothetical protein